MTCKIRIAALSVNPELNAPEAFIDKALRAEVVVSYREARIIKAL